MVNKAIKLGYRQTEIGVIPEDWAVTKLESIANVKTGPFGSSLHQRDYVMDGTPIITVEHLAERGVLHENLPKVSDSDKKRLNDYSLKKSDIVFSRVGSVDRNSLITDKEAGWLFSGRLLRIRLFAKNVVATYLSYYFNQESTKQRIKTVAVGQTMASLNTAILKKIDVIIPNRKEEQFAIAQVLTDTDELIGSFDRLIEKKKNIKQGTMQELLTGKKRLSGIWKTNENKKITDLGLIPEDWEVKSFNDLADKRLHWSITGGPFGSNLKASDYQQDGVRIIQLQNIGDGVFNDEYKIFTSDKKANELLSCNIYPGEIILSKMGDPVARACLVPNQYTKYLMSSDGIRLAVDKNRFSVGFVLNYINSIYFRKRAVEASTGSTRMRIGLSQLRRLLVIAPSKKEQSAIARVLTSMDLEIKGLEQTRDKYKLLKLGMMQQLLTGRIRLKCKN
jgi:type I restriction enzyme S subunit